MWFVVLGGDTMKSKHVLIIASIFWSNFASAQPSSGFHTGNEIFQICDNAAERSESLICSGYIAGIADALQLTKMICLPKHASVRQARDIVINYLRNHPESRASDQYFDYTGDELNTLQISTH